MHPATATAPENVSILPHRPRIFGAIPARYGSTRLPGKPLVEVAGRPMIVHVMERVAAADGLDRVLVLTDDERIAAVVEEHGGEYEMTPAGCASGTDRVAWAARGWPDVDGVVNVQGDWIIDPEPISRLAGHLAAYAEDPLVTLAVPATAADMADPAAVKVVCDRRGYALYFSRAAIPYRRRPAAAGAAAAEGAEVVPLKHWGIYGYRRQTLLDLAALAPTPLEAAESLEQLRALEHGIAIRVLVVDGEAASMDTAEDVARVDAALREQGA